MRREFKIIKSIPNLRINILNQNMNLMPQNFNYLYKLTNNISHSVGFEKFATQEICNQFKTPLYYTPSFIDLENCINKDFVNKKKIILYSKDYHPMKYKILDLIQDNFFDFQLKEIKKLHYTEFLEAISDALFCISFGEGFDGYYIQPYYAKSIGVSVYNDTFFPKTEMEDFPFVYKTYEDMLDNIVIDIKNIYQDKEKYEQISNNILNFFRQNINKKENTINGLRNFYNSNPDFIPNYV
jgi:hypothetical protein